MRFPWSPRRRQQPQAPSIARLARRPALVLLALLVILAANVAAAYLDLGGLQFSGNVLLALVSVGLIGLFLMNLDGEPPVNRLAASAGFVWLLLFFMLTFGDYMTRYSHPF
jgi:caa(3)-type oxidase subunit IV